jgi:hypothetical protein
MRIREVSHVRLYFRTLLSVRRIEEALNHKLVAFDTFLDIEEAFENNSSASMTLEIRDVNSIMEVQRGCPHGGVLWNMILFTKPTLYGSELELQNQVKYQGVILDSN